MDNKIGVVILNYMNYQDTIECVKSVLDQKIQGIEIVIVDNGSTNDSYIKIELQFKNYENIRIIKSKINLGYAKGNNLGIKELRKGGCHYIFVINSDVTFSSDRILSQMIKGCCDGVGIVLPIIKNQDGVLDQRFVCKKRYIILRVLKAIIIHQIFFLVKKTSQGKKISVQNIQEGVQENKYVITGSAFLLTPLFFENYEQLFPETFLYFEELATILLLHKAGLKSNLVNTDVVIHKGGASTPDDIKDISPARHKIVAESGRKIGKLIFMTSKSIAKKYSD